MSSIDVNGVDISSSMSASIFEPKEILRSLNNTTLQHSLLKWNECINDLRSFLTSKLLDNNFSLIKTFGGINNVTSILGHLVAAENILNANIIDHDNDNKIDSSNKPIKKNKQNIHIIANFIGLCCELCSHYEILQNESLSSFFIPKVMNFMKNILQIDDVRSRKIIVTSVYTTLAYLHEQFQSSLFKKNMREVLVLHPSILLTCCEHENLFTTGTGFVKTLLKCYSNINIMQNFSIIQSESIGSLCSSHIKEYHSIVQGLCARILALKNNDKIKENLMHAFYGNMITFFCAEDDSLRKITHSFLQKTIGVQKEQYVDWVAESQSAFSIVESVKLFQNLTAKALERFIRGLIFTLTDMTDLWVQFFSLHGYYSSSSSSSFQSSPLYSYILRIDDTVVASLRVLRLYARHTKSQSNEATYNQIEKLTALDLYSELVVSLKKWGFHDDGKQKSFDDPNATSPSLPIMHQIVLDEVYKGQQEGCTSFGNIRNFDVKDNRKNQNSPSSKEEKEDWNEWIDETIGIIDNDNDDEDYYENKEKSNDGHAVKRRKKSKIDLTGTDNGHHSGDSLQHVGKSSSSSSRRSAAPLPGMFGKGNTQAERKFKSKGRGLVASILERKEGDDSSYRSGPFGSSTNTDNGYDNYNYTNDYDHDWSNRGDEQEDNEKAVVFNNQISEAPSYWDNFMDGGSGVGRDMYIADDDSDVDSCSPLPQKLTVKVPKQISVEELMASTLSPGSEAKRKQDKRKQDKITGAYDDINLPSMYSWWSDSKTKHTLPIWQPSQADFLLLYYSLLKIDLKTIVKEGRNINNNDNAIGKKRGTDIAMDVDQCDNHDNLNAVPLRFNISEDYRSIFQPLLLLEVEESIKHDVTDPKLELTPSYYSKISVNNMKGSKGQSDIDKSKILKVKIAWDSSQRSEPLHRDELVVIPLTSTHSYGNTAKQVLTGEHMLGYVLSSRNDRGDDIIPIDNDHEEESDAEEGATGEAGPPPPVANEGKDENSNSWKFQTILVLNTPDVHKLPNELSLYRISQMSTVIREWAAIQGMKLEYHPLAPYLFSGEETVSGEILTTMSERLMNIANKFPTKEIRNKETPEEAQQKKRYRDHLITVVRNMFNPLRECSVQLSSLEYSNIVGSLKALKARVPEVAQEAQQLIKYWKENKNVYPLKSENQYSSTRMEEGGEDDIAFLNDYSSNMTNVIVPNKEDILQPATIPRSLWKALVNKHNPPQLLAISNVCKRLCTNKSVSSKASDIIEMKQGTLTNDDDDNDDAVGPSTPKNWSYPRDYHPGLQDTRISLIQGPPGTGKTSTIIGICGALLHHEGDEWDTTDTDLEVSAVDHKSQRVNIGGNRVVVCAHSNAAVDELVRRLSKGVPNAKGRAERPILVRLGQISDLSNPDLAKFTLEFQVQQILDKERDYITLENLRNDIIKMEARLPKIGNPSELKTLRIQIRERVRNRVMYEKIVDKLRVKISHDILHEAQIISGTLSSLGKYMMIILSNSPRGIFATIIDEACQATEPSTLIALSYCRCKRLVMVGDPCQLPATVLSRKAECYGYGQSLFVRLQKCGHPVDMLTVQYRMTPEIRLFPSQYFYGNLLEDDTSEYKQNDLMKTYTILNKFGGPSTMFINTDYHFRNKDNRLVEQAVGTSYVNYGEATYILDLVEKLLFNKATRTCSIGIITPYKAQVNYINDALRSKGRQSPRCMSATVDGFQGQERDVIIFSCVRTKHRGFLSDARRLNVAITRARKMLVIVGNATFLDKRCGGPWSAMIKSYTERNLMSFIPADLKYKTETEELNSQKAQKGVTFMIEGDD